MTRGLMNGQTTAPKVDSIPPEHKAARLCKACGHRARGDNRITVYGPHGNILYVLHKGRCNT